MHFGSLRIGGDANILLPFGLLKVVNVNVRNHCIARLGDSYGCDVALKRRLTVSHISSNQCIPSLAAAHAPQAKQWLFRFLLWQLVPPCATYMCCCTNISDLALCGVAASLEATLRLIPSSLAGSGFRRSFTGRHGWRDLYYVFTLDTADVAPLHCLQPCAYTKESHLSERQNS